LAKKTTKKMSDEHKAALAKGREQGRAVREYLAALSEEKKPGRRVDPETMAQKIAQVQEQIASEPDPAKRVEHIQKRLDLEAQQAEANGHVDLEALEQDFVEAAKEYSERKGITYSAWREAGVPAAVLKAAGVPRTRRPSAA
jgi:chromatin segregation and condensation protein Rec8/ScpA/Scc1 (kleisin family)